MFSLETIFFWIVSSSFLCVVTSSKYCYNSGISRVDGFCSDRSISSRGDVRVVVLASIHEPGLHRSCGEISPDIFQSAMAVGWIASILNGNDSDNDTFVPGIRIGYDIYDDCGKASFATDAILHALPSGKPTDLLTCDSVCGENNVPVLGVVAMTSLEATSAVRASLPTDFPMITARAPLSDKLLTKTTFSTVPSFQHEFQAIIQMMHAMKWNIISIIYSEDELGQQMFQFFQREFHKMDICIVYSTSRPATSVKDRNIYIALAKLQGEQEGEYLGVIYLGNPTVIASLLNSNHSVTETYRSKLQWILPSYVSENLDVQNAVAKFNKAIKNKVLFTLTPGKLQLPTFQTFMRETLIESAKYGNVSSYSPWVEKYISKVGGQPSIVQQSHVYPAVKALLSFALTLKNHHERLCGVVNRGICSELRDYLYPKAVSLDLRLSPTSAVFPEELQDNITMTVDTQHISLKGDSSVEVYYNAWNNTQYTKVASYVMNELQTTSTIPGSPSRCGKNRNCTVCIADDQKLTFGYIPGDVLILGLFSVREEGHPAGDGIHNVFKCGAYRSSSNAVMTISSFLQSIHFVNKLGLMSGLKFGGIALDDCYSPYNITDLLTKLFSGTKVLKDPASGAQIDFTSVVAAVGALSSKVTLIVADLLTSLKIPMVSYGASSASLDDRVRYPYFLRTVPSDTLQVAGLVKVLNEMNFTHVGAIYIDDAYGQNGIRSFRELAERNGICVENERTLSEKSSPQEIKHVMNEISQKLPSINENSLKVVLFYSIDTIAENILQVLNDRETSEKQSTKFTFVASEAWGTNDKLITEELGDAATGSLVFVTNVSHNSDDSYKTFLKNITFGSTTENPWLRLYLETAFDCDREGSFTRQRSRTCDPQQQLDDVMIDSISKDQRVVHVSRAVYAVTKGFVSVCDSKTCRFNVTDFTSAIRQSEMTDREGHRFQLFTADGNGHLGFDIYNIQRDTSRKDKRYFYAKVGNYSTDNTLVLDKAKVQIYGAGTPSLQIDQGTAACLPTYAQCANICPLSSTQKPQTPSPTTTTTPAPPMDQMLIFMSLLGGVILILLLVVLFMAVSLCRKNKAKTALSPSISQHSVVSRRHSLRSTDMYDSPRSTYSSINNLRVGKYNESFEMDDRAASASSGIVPGSSNASNGTTHKLEVPVEYSGIVAPNAHKYGSKSSVNTYLAPANQSPTVPKITISRDDSILRRSEQRSPSPLARSQSEGDVSGDQLALNYMTAKDLQMEDEELNYCEMSNKGSSQQTSPTSTGSTPRTLTAPKRRLPSINTVHRMPQNQTSPPHQRPTTLPGIKTHIIPPQNPPPYNSNQGRNPPPHFPTQDMTSYLQPTAYPPEDTLSTDHQMVPVTTAYIYASDGSSIPVLVTGTGEIISPAPTLSRSRMLPSVPTQSAQNCSTYVPQSLSLDFPYPSNISNFQNPYPLSNVDTSLDKYGIHFEHPPNKSLYYPHIPSSFSSAPTVNHDPLQLNHDHFTQLQSSHSVKPRLLSDINHLNSQNISQPHVSSAASPVMYATSPSTPRYVPPHPHTLDVNQQISNQKPYIPDQSQVTLHTVPETNNNLNPLHPQIHSLPRLQTRNDPSRLPIRSLSSTGTGQSRPQVKNPVNDIRSQQIIQLNANTGIVRDDENEVMI